MSEREPATSVGANAADTGVGSVFVSNYPPYSFWGTEALGALREAIDAPPVAGTPLGMYLHIPFCRRRCKFCYFRVFTDKRGDEVQRYMDALHRELELLAARAVIGGRPLTFVYFGGGTPSFISTRHLRELFAHLRSLFDWSAIEEVTFECEPGTLTRPKLEAIREAGVTRLSLGVENFNDEILAENGRAHVSKEIYRVVPWVRELAFDQLNIDLIAGMVGETWETWRETVRKTVDVAPDSVTIYQLELPFNTEYSKRLLGGGGVPVADWATKRAWHAYAFEQLAQAGYTLSSAYTMVRGNRPARFVYRNSVWRGCDLLSAGVSAFGHLRGVHYQNLSGWEPYLGRVEAGELPLDRAFVPTPEERLTRELILQLKLGRLETDYFREKFGVDVLQVFAPAWQRLQQRELLKVEDGTVRLSSEGLLRVDSLLPEFYAAKYQNSRYT